MYKQLGNLFGITWLDGMDGKASPVFSVLLHTSAWAAWLWISYLNNIGLYAPQVLWILGVTQRYSLKIKKITNKLLPSKMAKRVVVRHFDRLSYEVIYYSQLVNLNNHNVGLILAIYEWESSKITVIIMKHSKYKDWANDIFCAKITA